MKNYAISAVFLTLLSISAFGPVAIASGATSGQTGIPSQLYNYISNLPSNSPSTGCVSGTVSPFTANSTTCGGPNLGNAQSLVTNCSSDCGNGGYTTYSSGYVEYTGSFTAPSNPTVSPPYSGSTTFSEWTGLQSCNPASCSGTAYLLQAGEVWGESSSYPSNAPTVFEEFAASSGGCSTWNSNCATLGTWTVKASTDALYFEVNCCTSGKWLLYSQDTTQSLYQLMYITVGTGTYDIPVSSMNYGFTTSEGQGTTASNQLPGAVSIFDIVGQHPAGTDVLGTNTVWNNPSSGSQSVTLSYSTGTCTWGTNTCGTQDITVT